MNVTVTNAASIRRSSSTVEYLDVSGIESKSQLVMFSQLVKLNYAIMPSAMLIEMALNQPDDFFAGLNENIKQVAIIPSLEIRLGLGELQTIGNIIDDYANIPRLTKEQFYSLDTEFTIDSQSYTILSGQTWADWIESGNAPERFVVDNGYIKDSELSDILATYYVALDGTQVASTDVILDKAYETIESLGGGGGSAGA